MNRALARLPLRTRLVGILLIALIAALALTGWATQYVLRGYLVGQVDASLRANAVSATLTALDAAQGRLRSGRTLAGGVTVTLWIPGGSGPVVAHPPNVNDRPEVEMPSGDVASVPATGFPSASLGPIRTTNSVDGDTTWRYMDVRLTLP